MKPRVKVLSLGGTVAMLDAPDGSGLRPDLDAADLMAATPGTDRYACVHSEALRRLPGAQLTLTDMLAVADAVEAAAKSGADGIVITQGTDTLEETAFALDLLVDVAIPVVVTGAMRPPGEPGTDGPANLRDAIITAASAPPGHGVFVVIGAEVHAAPFVRKAHTSVPSAFISAPGPLGWVVEQRLHLLSVPARRARLPARPASVDASVALITASLGCDDRLLRAVPALGYAGTVIEAMGAGHLPDALVEAAAALAASQPVILTSRTGSGPLLRHTYGFPGSERDLLARGLVHGGYLDGLKARVALTLLLSASADANDIAGFFTRLAETGQPTEGVSV